MVRMMKPAADEAELSEKEDENDEDAEDDDDECDEVGDEFAVGIRMPHVFVLFVPRFILVEIFRCMLYHSL